MTKLITIPLGRRQITLSREDAVCVQEFLTDLTIRMNNLAHEYHKNMSDICNVLYPEGQQEEQT